MSQQLISHSPDLKQLRDEGLEIEIKGGYLLIHQIPYVNTSKEIRRGTLISTLDLADQKRTVRPRTHVMFFIGECPCDIDGTPIQSIINASRNSVIGKGLEINFTFSSKPSTGYDDYYQKVTTYVKILSNPAKAIDSSVSEKTFKVIKSDIEDSVFHYMDTNSSRANIEKINSKLKGQNIAIIGLGGTGAYILDLVAKTPVQAVHLYDGDDFLLHNSFRSPGAASIVDLEKRKMKTDYYADIYSHMHKHIVSHPYYVDGDNISEFENKSFVFIAIDKDSVKKEIIDFLVSKRIPFVDVGLGVNIAGDTLIGSIRVTTSTDSKYDHLYDRISCGDDLENEYNTNIQIAELNSFNAALAVIKWKKIFGFYSDSKQEHNQTFTIDFSLLSNDDITT